MTLTSPFRCYNSLEIVEREFQLIKFHSSFNFAMGCRKHTDIHFLFCALIFSLKNKSIYQTISVILKSPILSKYGKFCIFFCNIVAIFRMEINEFVWRLLTTKVRCRLLSWKGLSTRFFCSIFIPTADKS